MSWIVWSGTRTCRDLPSSPWSPSSGLTVQSLCIIGGRWVRLRCLWAEWFQSGSIHQVWQDWCHQVWPSGLEPLLRIWSADSSARADCTAYKVLMVCYKINNNQHLFGGKTFLEKTRNCQIIMLFLLSRIWNIQKVNLKNMEMVYCCQESNGFFCVTMCWKRMLFCISSFDMSISLSAMSEEFLMLETMRTEWGSNLFKYLERDGT